MTAAKDSERANTLSRAIVQLAGAMIASIRNDETVIARVHDLTKAVGRNQTADVMTPATVALLNDLTAMLIEVALPGLIDESTDAHLADIRRFFLDPKEDYGITEPAALWRMTVDDVRNFLDHEIEKWEDATEQPEASYRMSWADVVGASTKFNLLRAFDVEVAIAEDFDCARSDRWRTVPLLIRLPRFIVESIADPTIAGSFRAHNDVAVCVEDFFLEIYQDEYRANLLQLADDTDAFSGSSGDAADESDRSSTS